MFTFLTFAVALGFIFCAGYAIWGWDYDWAKIFIGFGIMVTSLMILCFSKLTWIVEKEACVNPEIKFVYEGPAELNKVKGVYVSYKNRTGYFTDLNLINNISIKKKFEIVDKYNGFKKYQGTTMVKISE